MIGAGIGAVGAAVGAATSALKNAKKKKKDNNFTSPETYQSLLSGVSPIGSNTGGGTKLYSNANKKNGLDMDKMFSTNYQSILNYKNNYMNAKTPEEKAYWNQLTNEQRKKDGYYGGTDGLANIPILNLPDMGKYEYKGKGSLVLDMPELGDFNYKDFLYEAEKDPSFQSYKDMYTRQGQSASEAALVNTAAATGGVASSYAAAANAQAQQAYAKKVSDMIPVLEQQAYDRYDREKNFDYQAFLNDYYADVDRAKSEYQSAFDDRNFDYQKYLNEYYSDRDNALSKYNSMWDTKSYFDNQDWKNKEFNYKEFLDNRDYNYTLEHDAELNKQWWTSRNDKKEYEKESANQWWANHYRGIYEDDRDYDLDYEKYYKDVDMWEKEFNEDVRQYDTTQSYKNAMLEQEKANEQNKYLSEQEAAEKQNKEQYLATKLAMAIMEAGGIDEFLKDGKNKERFSILPRETRDYTMKLLEQMKR